MQKTDLNLEKIQAALTDCAIGHTFQYHQSIESTMPLAHQACQTIVPSGMVIIAEHQTQGRGRLKRTWETPFGKAILLGVVLGAELLPTEIDVLPILTAVAIRQAAVKTMPQIGDDIFFKWPNDILGRVTHNGSEKFTKVTGILTETAFVGSSLKYAVLGIGINVNQVEDEFPQDIQSSTTPSSLRLVAGQPIDRTQLFINLCQALSEQCARPKSEIVKSWRSHLHTLGKSVTVTETALTRPHNGNTDYAIGSSSAPSFSGIAVDITSDGHLVVEDAQGERRTFSSGEATLRSSQYAKDDV